MTHYSARNRRSPVLVLRGLRAALIPLGTALASCSGDIVNMGEDSGDLFVPPAHSSCVTNASLSADVVISSQAELDALEGCTTIDGHLLIMPLFDPDLRPLHELAVVSGELGLGGSNVWSPRDWTREEAALARETVEHGFLRSLEGLERIESIGSLNLSNVAAGSLAPLARLANLTGYGMLSISHCDHIGDLTPLAQLSGIRRLGLSGANIESLDGLQIEQNLELLELGGPKLTNIDALSRLSSVEGDLSISDSGLRDLAPLAQLAHAGTVTLTGNAKLVTLQGLEGLRSAFGGVAVVDNDALQDVTALAGLDWVGGFTLRENDNLRRLPEFSQIRTTSIHIMDNAVLEEVPVFPALSTCCTPPRPEYSRIETLAVKGQLQVARNAALQRLSAPRGWQDGVYVVIDENVSLRELDLGDLETIDLLEIRNNPALASVRLGALDAVDALQVVDNPLLPATSFDSVRSFERTMSGNAGDAL